MSEITKIQWTHKTWNPWHGCIKVSEECKFCYMYTEKKMYGQDPTKVVRSKTTFNDPLKWSDPALVFTCSWSDFFIKEADEWRDAAWHIIKHTPHLTYQILTKRPELIPDRLPKDWGKSGYSNVWLGVSVGNQKRADERIFTLLNIPARVRFLSIEPLLDEVKLRYQESAYGCVVDYLKGHRSAPDYEDAKWDGCGEIHWVIVGGESGPGARACKIEHIRTIVKDCKRGQYDQIPVFVKQLGAKPTLNGQRVKLKDRKGGNMDEWPDDLKVREFPKSYKPEVVKQ